MSIEKINWNDISLGCPQPGLSYAQAIVPGFNLTFGYQGDTIEVHSSNDGSQLATCAA
jgi:hypothetical protein